MGSDAGASELDVAVSSVSPAPPLVSDSAPLELSERSVASASAPAAVVSASPATPEVDEEEGTVSEPVEPVAPIESISSDEEQADAPMQAAVTEHCSRRMNRIVDTLRERDGRRAYGVRSPPAIPKTRPLRRRRGAHDPTLVAMSAPWIPSARHRGALASSYRISRAETLKLALGVRDVLDGFAVLVDVTSTAFSKPLWPVLDMLRALRFTVEMTSAGLFARRDPAHTERLGAAQTLATNLTAALAHRVHVARHCASDPPR